MVVIDEHDLGKTKVELLMDLLYESTGMRIPMKWITYGDPSALDARPEVLTDPNTFIPATIDATFNYNLAARIRGFLYRRRSLKKHFEGVVLDLQFPRWPMTLHEIILTQINPKLKYPLRCEDFIDYTIEDRYASHLRIEAHPHSWFWMGETDVAIEQAGNQFFVLFEIPHMPGFQKAPREISGAARKHLLDGYIPTDASMDELVGENPLDGFVGVPDDRLALEDEVLDAVDGFVLTPGPLEDNLPESADGFEATPGDLEDRLTGTLEGFELTPGTVEAMISTDTLDGFDPEAAVVQDGSDTTWNPLDKTANMVLSEDNMVFTESVATSEALRSTRSVTGPLKLYWEIELINAASESYGIRALEDSLGSAPNAGTTASIREGGSNIFVSGGPVAGINPGDYDDGEVLCFHLDLVEGKMWVGVNNVLAGGGNPLTGAAPTVSNIPNDKNWCIYAWCDNSGAITSGRLNTGRKKPYNYGPLPGYEPF